MNPDNKPKDQTQESSSTNVCLMKRGDYMIHVFVEQAKNLKIDEEDTVDPIVQINCLGMRKFTSA